MWLLCGLRNGVPLLWPVAKPSSMARLTPKPLPDQK